MPTENIEAGRYQLPLSAKLFARGNEADTFHVPGRETHCTRQSVGTRSTLFIDFFET